MHNGYEVVLYGPKRAPLTRPKAREWAATMRQYVGWPVGGRITVRPAPRKRTARKGRGGRRG